MIRNIVLAHTSKINNQKIKKIDKTVTKQICTTKYTKYKTPMTWPAGKAE